MRALTTALLVLGLCLVAAWPWVLAAKPSGVRELQVYSVWFGIYLTSMFTAFLGAAAFAILVARRARRQYFEESKQNLQELIEGTLSDHRGPKSSVDDGSR